ncbi:DUF342 domain-containing protein [Desulfamplus magnetovallimortis]|uniref:DUF342 domain-containing protein n=1 Tax=Desulfamplus magnetovallimortis TaxID=1246637 RepID=UPI00111A98E8|nr:FapA family protein [Desulfamplus magnetovallimortis]
MNKNKEDALSTRISLAGVLDHKKVEIQPVNLFREFLLIDESLKNMLGKVASNHVLEWRPAEVYTIINGETRNYDLNIQSEIDDETETRNEAESSDTEENEFAAEEQKKSGNAPLIEKVKRCLYISTLSTDVTIIERKGGIVRYEGEEKLLDQYLELTVSNDKIEAFIRKKKELKSEIVNLSSLLYFLKKKRITYGIISDEEIEKWLMESTPEADEKPFVIARGVKPIAGQDGSVNYLFRTDYTNPGKIMKDGSIDFRDKGDMPYVNKDTLLAIKTPFKEGISGVDVFGIKIMPQEPFDPPFTSGNGTIISEDKLQITSAANGQPHVDIMGNITVNDELVIKGDVDLKTGNVIFKGNIVVNGIIKEGMTVKGINLTAKEIEGATIDLKGDLNVANGISHTTVKAVGNIHTKFVNSSQITGFGDFTVEKEIVDSNLILSGSCNVLRGTVMASTLNARKGIETKQVGTIASKPSNLVVGTDDIADLMEKKIDELLEEGRITIDKIRKAMNLLNGEDEALFTQITESAHIQDRALFEIEELKKQLVRHRESNDNNELKKVAEKIKTLKERAHSAEDLINSLFEKQGVLTAKRDKLSLGIEQQEKKNMVLLKEKRIIGQSIRMMEPNPTVKVNGTILQGSKIIGPGSSIVLEKDYSRCIIREMAKDEDNPHFFEMEIKGI